jgi:hypothetical protein
LRAEREAGSSPKGKSEERQVLFGCDNTRKALGADFSLFHSRRRRIADSLKAGCRALICHASYAVCSPSRRFGKCYTMNMRFGGCSEILACRGREVLSILIEIDPISGKEFEQLPGCLREGVSAESREVLEKLYLAEDHWRHHHRIPRGSCGQDVHCRRSLQCRRTQFASTDCHAGSSPTNSLPGPCWPIPHHSVERGVFLTASVTRYPSSRLKEESREENGSFLQGGRDKCARHRNLTTHIEDGAFSLGSLGLNRGGP